MFEKDSEIIKFIDELKIASMISLELRLEVFTYPSV